MWKRESHFFNNLSILIDSVDFGNKFNSEYYFQSSSEEKNREIFRKIYAKMMATISANWQNNQTKRSMACGGNLQPSVNSLPKKLKTYFRQRYQTEHQQPEAARIEKSLDPWRKAWLLYAVQQDSKTLQQIGDITSGGSSNGISTAEKRHRCPLQDIQNEALDLSMETLSKKIRTFNIQHQMNGSLKHHRIADKRPIVEMVQKTEESRCSKNHKPNRMEQPQTDDFCQKSPSKQSNKSSNEMNDRDHDKYREAEKSPASPNQYWRIKRNFCLAQRTVPEYLKCPSCDYKSTSTTNFTRHVRNHQATKQYQCEICKRGFKRSDNLRTHMRIHFKTALPFKCNRCGHGFVREQTKDAHEHRCNSLIYGCGKCKFQSKDLTQFLGHYAIEKCFYDVIKSIN